MAEVVETLIVKVEGDLSDLRKDMKKSGDVVKKGSKDMTRSTKAASQGFSNLGKSALKLAATIGVVGLAFKSIRSIFVEFGAVDALAKTADRLGITTEGLVGLQFAASQTGVESNVLGTSLQRLNRRLSEVANTGGGVAKKGLDALGLTAEQLLKLPLEQQFGLIGDRLNEVASVADKTAIAFGFFDTEGGKLLNTLRVGTAGLDAFRQEAQDLGIAISRVDAAKIEAANDTLDKLTQTFVGASRTMAVQLAPAIDFVAGEFVKMQKEAQGTSPIIDILAKTIVGGFRAGQIAVAGFRATFNAAIVGFGKLGEIATQGALIAVRAFRRMQAGMSGAGFVVLDILDGLTLAFKIVAETADDLWQLVRAGADIAASAVLLVFDKSAQGIGGVLRGIRSAFAAALDTAATVIAAGEGFLDIRTDVAAKLVNAAGDIKLANIREAAAAKESVEIAAGVLDAATAAFKQAGADLFTVEETTGSEVLQQMSADLVSLANSQLEASRQGDELTESLGENLALIRQFTAEAEAGLDAAIDEGGAVGTVAQALEEFEALRSARETAFQAEIDRRIEHKNQLATINKDAVDTEFFLALDAADALLALANKNAATMARIENVTNQRRLAAGQQFLSDLSTLTQSENRKAFEVGKAAAIAEAGVNTFLAATKAYQALAGIPVVGPGLGAAAAAAALAAGFINIQRIRSMQFGGGGAGGAAGAPRAASGAGGAGGGAGGAGGDGGGQQGGPVQTQQFNISLEGERFTQSQVRQLIEDINEARADNATFVVT